MDWLIDRLIAPSRYYMIAETLITRLHDDDVDDGEYVDGGNDD